LPSAMIFPGQAENSFMKKNVDNRSQNQLIY
jgi:hypothetical protein